jgi:hypothetical protein
MVGEEKGRGEGSDYQLDTGTMQIVRCGVVAEK